MEILCFSHILSQKYLIETVLVLMRIVNIRNVKYAIHDAQCMKKLVKRGDFFDFQNNKTIFNKSFSPILYYKSNKRQKYRVTLHFCISAWYLCITSYERPLQISIAHTALALNRLNSFNRYVRVSMTYLIQRPRWPGNWSSYHCRIKFRPSQFAM